MAATPKSDRPRPGDWVPTPKQSKFLASTANECLYGGSAGGGKSWGAILLPLRWVHIPRFRALILRRESTQLGDLIDKAIELYPRAFKGARFNHKTNTCTFPSGAKIRFNHCEHESDASIYDGFEFQLVEFEELTHFTLKQYLTIRARLRSATPGLPRYTRATTNPGGVGGDWVFLRWGAWLDPEFMAEGLEPRFSPNGQKLPPARPGQTLWYVKGADEAERFVPEGTPGARSRVFIPATLADNPHLLANDPDYANALRDLDPVRRAQLLDGNWTIKPAKGLYFKRSMFTFVDKNEVPAIARRLRYWDRAATEPHAENKDPDWTVGVRMARSPDKIIWIEDATRMRGAPGAVESTIKATAEMDGRSLPVCLEQDPAQAGKAEMSYYVKSLQGFNVRAIPKRTNKLTAAGPFSAQCAAGNVRIVRGPWNEAFLQTLEQFPEKGAHDDDVDAASGAFNTLTGNVAAPEYDDSYDNDLPRNRM